MKGMLIVFSTLLLCSCKKGALPLHSAYVYDQRATTQPGKAVDNFADPSNCAGQSACLEVKSAVSGNTALSNTQRRTITCTLD